MSLKTSACILIICAAFFAFTKTKSDNNVIPLTHEIFEPVALIELFTSQGCSSCPAADALLAQTLKNKGKEGTKIFALSFHVDYWNRLGWKDPFSSAVFSQRQSEYVSAFHLNSAYTPQMIVNGTKEFVGSEKAELSAALSNALQTKAEVSFSKFEVSTAGDIVNIKYDLNGNYANSALYFALVSVEETTLVKKGENGGRVLKNENVVRQLISVNARAGGAASFKDLPPEAHSNFAVIAFVQENKSKK